MEKMVLTEKSGKKIRLFIENFIIYGFGGILGKVISLVMVPIVTRIIPDKGAYGISDLSNTLVSLGSVVAMVGMYDAMYRLFFDKDNESYKKKVCSTALFFTIFTSLIVFWGMVLSRSFLASFVFSDRKYEYVVWISAFTLLIGTTNSIVSAPTRMQNKRMIYVTVNFIAPIISYSIALVLLSKGYYVIGIPMGLLLSNVLVELFFLLVNRRWFDWHCIDKKVLKELLWIGAPVMPSVLMYWLFNSCDRVMISNMLGIDYSGVYTTSSKMGQISHLVYSAFAGGWQFFAFSTMKEKGQVESNSRIFEYLGAVSFVASIFMCGLAYAVFRIIFTSDYWEGYIATPYLFLAPLIQMLYQVVGNQFAVVKKTWISPLVLSTGVVANYVLNRLLIPVLGIEGASIATLSGYVVTVAVAMAVAMKMRLFVFSKRFLFTSIILAAYIVSWRLWYRENIVISLLMAFVFSGMIICAYLNEIKEIISYFPTIIGKRRIKK